MANSKDRRKLKRMLQEAGLGPLLATPAQRPQPPASKSILRKTPSYLYWFCAICAIAIGISQGYPWLHLEKDYSLNPSNPFAQRWLVVNGGYIPVTDLDAVCIANATQRATGSTYGDIRDTRKQFADYLGHDGRVTVPCLTIWTGTKPIFDEGATLDITISYAFYHLNLQMLRRSQAFHFRSKRAIDGSQGWESLAN